MEEQARRVRARLYAIVQRCYNRRHPRYWDYGGRGIRVHRGWLNNYPAFLKYVLSLPGWYTPGAELTRIDSDGDFEPGNLKWMCLI